jgi:hypothetical protein
MNLSDVCTSLPQQRQTTGLQSPMTHVSTMREPTTSVTMTLHRLQHMLQECFQKQGIDFRAWSLSLFVRPLLDQPTLQQWLHQWHLDSPI